MSDRPVSDLSGDERLDALFAAYRDACPEPEAGRNFMPALWRRIEEHQQPSVRFRRLARAFATVGAVVTLAMAAFLFGPLNERMTSPVYQSTYVEVLADEQATEAAALGLLGRPEVESDLDLL
ncbi:MAG: hypothetical protein IPM24_26755 [Bryobacterales bacterium]|nr:hypothetical protein [Bryobacterales bacterium]